MSAAPYVLWLGPVVDEATLLAGYAVSPAANRWQSGLIGGLRAEGREVVTISHLPMAAWPKGHFWLGESAGKGIAGVEAQFLSYVNAPGVRHLALTANQLRSLATTLRTRGQPELVVSYNFLWHTVVAGFLTRALVRVPWVCVIADAERLHSYAPYELASGRVFLSWRGFEEERRPPKLHIDGGVAAIRPFSPSLEGPPRIVFTGAINRYGGIDLLARAFGLLAHESAELWVCGKGSDATLDSLARANERVKVLGLVPEAQLEEVVRGASVLVNPRPPSIPENANNFPSKLPEYLSYGIPVVSTWTAGLSPDYREHLLVADETPQHLAARIDEALSWGEGRRKKYHSDATDFIASTRAWRVQAQRLLRWVAEEVR